MDGVRVAVDAGGQPKHDLLQRGALAFPTTLPIARCCPWLGLAPGLTTCIFVPGLTLLCCLQRGCRKLYVLIQTKAGKILLMSFLGS